MMGSTGLARVHFGGPDLPVGALRDLLEARVDETPAGGEIVWATYYFRDRRLANALVRASRRGVRVRVAVERNPRQGSASHAALELLSDLDGGLQRFGSPFTFNVRKPHLHSKIYAFSHPEPSVLIGSFNPSGDEPEEDPDLIAEIGDQDRGHNLLVEHRSPEIVRALRAHALRLHDLSWPGRIRFLPSAQRVITCGDVRIWIFPRIRTRVLDSILGQIGAGERLRVAMSHLKSKSGLEALCAAAKRGAQVQAIVHHTDRRAPVETVDALTSVGAEVLRYHHPSGFPMHAKFMLVEGPGRRLATYGSLNFNVRSQQINHEIFVADEKPDVFARLDDRWHQIESECRSQSEAFTAPPPSITPHSPAL